MSECFVYVIAIEGQDLCKVGISKSPQTRLAQLLTGSPFKMEIVQTFRAPDRDTALLLESKFHDVMRKVRCNREWFNLSRQNAVELMASNYYSMLRRQFNFDQDDSIAIMAEMGIPFDLSCWVAIETEPSGIIQEALQ